MKTDHFFVTRELLGYGWEFLMLKHYRDEKLSLEGLSKKLDLSISETIDMLAEFGIEAPIEFKDYLKGFEVFAHRS